MEHRTPTREDGPPGPPPPRASGPAEPPPRSSPGWLRVLRAPFLLLAALVLALEEWLWEPLRRFMARLGQLPVLRAVERFIASLPPWAALGTFALPSVVLLPAKLLGLHLLATGHPLLGVSAFIAAKVVGTAIVGRLFTLTEPALRRIGWLARALDAFQAFKRRIFAAIRDSAPFRAAAAALRALRVRVRALFVAHEPP